MKTQAQGIEIEVTRGTETWRMRDVSLAVAPADMIELFTENDSDPQESTIAALTPTEARQLAADLTRMADECEGKS